MNVIKIFRKDMLVNSHKKRKNSLEGSLDRVLIVVKLEFLKILIPRLPQNKSNVNTGCAEKSKQLCSSVTYLGKNVWGGG